MFFICSFVLLALVSGAMRYNKLNVYRYGTGEFEVTTERLGCYQPTEHIDNPLGYAEGDDAQLYDRRFRGPVDSREVEIDQRTGMSFFVKNSNGSRSYR